MGQTLSSPATEKHSESGADSRYLYAVSEMQGWRITMEDAHTAALKLTDDGEELDDGNAFFAVYDGHGGSSVARFAGQNVHKRLVKEEAYHNQNWAEAMRRAFLGTDEDMLADQSYTKDPSGCTAVATLVTKDGKIICANAGDSRSVLSVRGAAKPLSYDHKPQNQTERNRVIAAGGFIEFGRVNGNLALARALGDFEYKKNYSIQPEAQIITANPDIIEHQITEDDEFIIIACDGIWDCLSSQQVVNVVRLQVSEGKELSEICENLCELCLAPDTTSGAGIGCDNMTVLIVALLGGKTKEEWYAMIKDRVQRQNGYATPDALPQIYAANRLMNFRARRQAMDDRNQEFGSAATFLGGQSGLQGLARVLSNAGGISFHPGSGILSDAGTLMFQQDDSEDDLMETGEMETDGHDAPFFSNEMDSNSPPPDLTKSLKEQLDELDREDADIRFEDAEDDEEAFKEPFESVIDLSDAEKNRAESRVNGISSPASSTDTQQPSSPHADAPSPTQKVLQGEAPPPPKEASQTNGLPVAQFKSQPGGDAPSDVVRAEGLLDKSEDPLRV